MIIVKVIYFFLMSLLLTVKPFHCMMLVKWCVSKLDRHCLHCRCLIVNKEISEQLNWKGETMLCNASICSAGVRLLTEKIIYRVIYNCLHEPLLNTEYFHVMPNFDCSWFAWEWMYIIICVHLESDMFITQPHLEEMSFAVEWTSIWFVEKTERLEKRISWLNLKK